LEIKHIIIAHYLVTIGCNWCGSFRFAVSVCALQLQLQEFRMVSVFEGQLTRTWYFRTEKRNHILSLFHDTITGIRSCTVDFEEVPGSLGNSSLLMEATGHRIFFTVENDNHGFFEIRGGIWSGFEYYCIVNDEALVETTNEVAKHQDPIYKCKIEDAAFIQDELSEDQIAWYRIVTTRITDNVTTSVHRRFKEFADLNSQVKQNFKGHHLRSSIPEFPEKTLKVFADHRDPAFVQERVNKLERYMTYLFAVPHINDMTCVKAFLGLMDQVKELSVVFHIPTLGMTLLPTDKVGTPCVVGNLQKRADAREGGCVQPGDVLSKINGLAVADSSYNGCVARIKQLPRPLMVHFIQILPGNEEAQTATVSMGSMSTGAAASSPAPAAASGSSQRLLESSPINFADVDAPDAADPLGGTTPTVTAPRGALRQNAEVNKKLMAKPEEEKPTARPIPFDSASRSILDELVGPATKPSTASSGSGAKVKKPTASDLFGPSNDIFGEEGAEEAEQARAARSTPARPGDRFDLPKELRKKTPPPREPTPEPEPEPEAEPEPEPEPEPAAVALPGWEVDPVPAPTPKPPAAPAAAAPQEVSLEPEPEAAAELPGWDI
jgi:hypothetical protein